MIKSETTSSRPAATDEEMLGVLQARVESLQDELSIMKKNRNQILRRLKQKMKSESLDELVCGTFVLRQTAPNSDDEEDAVKVDFCREKLEEHFTEDAVQEYCDDPTNHKKKRKRPAFSFERIVVDITD